MGNAVVYIRLDWNSAAQISKLVVWLGFFLCYVVNGWGNVQVILMSMCVQRSSFSSIKC